MLRELTIQNYAIIDTLSIEFSQGLNIITGETGAGKSILLGALSLLAGTRADAAVIKDNTRNCILEATFEIEGYGLEPFFAENDLEHHNTISMRRTIAPTGRSRAFVDDTPVSLTLLRTLSDRLIDIHSQHQTLLLAEDSFQTRIVDVVAENGATLLKFQETFGQLRKAERELQHLTESAQEAARRREYLTYQLDQLEEAGIKAGEESLLEEEQQTLSHATEIAESLSYTDSAIFDDEQGMALLLKNITNSLGRIKRHYPAAEELHSRSNALYLELRDMGEDARRMLDNLEIDPARLTQVEERLNTIYTLCQKHGASDSNHLLELKAQMEEELMSLNEGEDKIEELKNTIETLSSQTIETAAKITTARAGVTHKIEQHVVHTLKELGIKDAQLKIEITPAKQLTASGADTIAFLFSGNRGVEPQPIEQVASGGEMSRVMLSLKGLIAKHIKLPTIIFDEIDTGVSGAVADRMGEIIYAMSHHMQVLNITHLPQVAAKGDNHYFVYKDNGTHIRKLTPEQRIEQIALMLSGSNITDAARTQAAELLK